MMNSTCIRCISKQHTKLLLAPLTKTAVGTSLKRSFHTRGPLCTQEQDQEQKQEHTPSSTEETSSLPWYMRETESPSLSSPLKQAEIPEIPSDSPQSLQPMLEFICNKLGITDLEVFDLRNPADNQVNEGAEVLSDFMIIGTGKSPKHLQKATSELNFFIKTNLKTIPRAEGILTSGQLAKFQRRLRKKGKRGPAYANNDYGAAANTWVMMDCKIDDIYVHFLTAERRQDLNLESLWAKDKSKYAKTEDPVYNDSIFAGIRYYSTINNRRSNDFMKSLKQLNQFKPYSTIVDFNPESLQREDYTRQFQNLQRQHLKDPEAYPFNLLERHLLSMQANGIPVTIDSEIYPMIETMLQSEEFHNHEERKSAMFAARYSFVRRLLHKFNPVITKSELEKLYPLLIICGSRMDDPNFLSLDSKKTEKYPFSTIVPKLYELSDLLFTGSLEGAQLQAQLDIIFLTIFYNRDNWKLCTDLLNTSIKRGDIGPTVAALKLIGSKGINGEGSLSFCQKFIDSFLPLLITSDQVELKDLKEDVESLLNKCDPDGNFFHDIRQQF